MNDPIPAFTREAAAEAMQSWADPTKHRERQLEERPVPLNRSERRRARFGGAGSSTRATVGPRAGRGKGRPFQTL